MCAATPLSASLLSIWSWNRSSCLFFVFFSIPPRFKSLRFLLTFQFILYLGVECSYTLFSSPYILFLYPYSLLSMLVHSPWNIYWLFSIPRNLHPEKPPRQFNTLCLAPPTITSAFSSSPLHIFMSLTSPPPPLLVFRYRETPHSIWKYIYPSLEALVSAANEYAAGKNNAVTIGSKKSKKDSFPKSWSPCDKRAKTLAEEHNKHNSSGRQTECTFQWRLLCKQ